MWMAELTLSSVNSNLMQHLCPYMSCLLVHAPITPSDFSSATLSCYSGSGVLAGDID